MSDFRAIRGVTETLKAVLTAKIPGVTIEEKKTPGEISATVTMIGLYLYRMEHNASIANLEWEQTSAIQLTAAPVGINLHYLVIPYGPEQLQIQQTLGEVVRAFHERAVVKAGDAELSPVLAGMTEELRIVPRTLPLTELLDLWRGFDKINYRLCATYEVSTVLIDSRTTRAVERVQERVLEVSPRR